MPDFIIRRARESDVPAIVAMLADDALGATRESLEDLTPYLEAFAEVDAQPHQLLVVAEQHGRLVGTAQLAFMAGLSHKGMRRAEIEAVRIHAGERGNGLGTLLIEWCIREARARECGMVQLTSNASRTSARRFYERLGFTPSHVGFKLRLDRTAVKGAQPSFDAAQSPPGLG
ncbi:MAG: GNAT family N-acetyltransferase [Chloroflexia bacterium]|nr:GNAT family N-acetyltransferase [Chloroflexia bacterium]